MIVSCMHRQLTVSERPCTSRTNIPPALCLFRQVHAKRPFDVLFRFRELLYFRTYSLGNLWPAQAFQNDNIIYIVFFSAPWEKVAPAILRKYPNPFNSHCKTIDVVDRQVDKNGILTSHRIMGAYWDICGLGKHVNFFIKLLVIR